MNTGGYVCYEFTECGINAQISRLQVQELGNASKEGSALKLPSNVKLTLPQQKFCTTHGSMKHFGKSGINRFRCKGNEVSHNVYFGKCFLVEQENGLLFGSISLYDIGKKQAF